MPVRLTKLLQREQEALREVESSLIASFTEKAKALRCAPEEPESSARRPGCSSTEPPSRYEDSSDWNAYVPSRKALPLLLSILTCISLVGAFEHEGHRHLSLSRKESILRAPQFSVSLTFLRRYLSFSRRHRSVRVRFLAHAREALSLFLSS